MLGLLARERAALAGDAQALTAVRRGLRERVKQFAWYYEDRGQRTAATGICLGGFRLTRDPELLVRAASENHQRWSSGVSASRRSVRNS